MARRYYSSTAARTTLASGVDDTTTTLSVVAVSGWPASYPYTLVIDQDTVNEELVEVSARTGTTLTVTRGVDGTSAVAHDAGAAVNHGVSARDFDEPNEFINGTGVVTESMLASNAVTSAKILDGTIVNADINASAAIAQSKLSEYTVNAQTGTTYTFVAADGRKLVSSNNSSAVTFTIPPQSSVAWGDNTILRVVNYGSGAVTIEGGSGVTVTNTASTIGENVAAAAIRTGSDAWTVVPFSGGGDLAGAAISDTPTGNYTSGGVTFDYWEFDASSSITVTQAGLADVLVVGGGGGGGDGANASYGGGGGGAGGMVVAAGTYLTAGTHTVTVGAGGICGKSNTYMGQSGNASRMGTLYAPAGGGGGAASGLIGSAFGSGINGGSGGGAGGNSLATGGSGTSGIGNDGAACFQTNGGGGGGGAGAAGSIGSLNTGGAGGAGTANSYTGSSVTYAGGGGGHGVSTGGTGGVGGGGNGGGGNGAGGNGTANTGGGGGGTGDQTNGNGGSGKVVVRVARPYTPVAGFASIGNTATGTYSSGGATYAFYSFTSSGTLTVNTAGFADVLVVGGGAGGGSAAYGGGGAGGAGGHLYITQTYLAAGSLTVTVGAGGSAGPRQHGSDSRLDSLVAVGGGGAGPGGNDSNGDRAKGGSGGSGGGGGHMASLTALGGNGVTLQGNAGGSSTTAPGGGGGAGGAASGGTGGAGLANSITGSSVTRAAGGSMGTTAAGAANSGNGASVVAGATASGGSGIVIVRVRTA